MASQAKMKLYHELRYFAQRRIYLGPYQTSMNFTEFFKTVILMVILYLPTPQNEHEPHTLEQFVATADELFECV